MYQKCYPDRRWSELNGKVQAALIRQELLQRHFLLDPHQSFMKVGDMFMIHALIPTAFLAPFTVAFDATGVSAMSVIFWINCCVDLIFLIYMFLQFF